MPNESDTLTIDRDTINGWKIFCDENGRWEWIECGDDMKIIKKSSQSFDTREECEADAKSYGMNELWSLDLKTEDDVSRES